MISSVRHHLRHHARFYAAAAAGGLAWGTLHAVQPTLAVVVAGNTFFGLYLITTAIFALDATPDDLRDRASAEDEGIGVIVVITVAAIVVSLASIFSLLGQEEGGTPCTFSLPPAACYWAG